LRGSGGALVFATFLGASAASLAARAEPTRVRLSYRATPDCPGEDAFVAALTAQAHPFARAPRSAARVRSLDAEIARSDSGHTGHLRVREADGVTSERDVRGSTCADVFSALALVTALAIDSGPPAPRPPPPDEPPPPAPATPRRWGWSTAVVGGGFFAMAPVPAWGVEPSLEAVPPLPGGVLAVRLSLALAASPRTTTRAGDADFFWLTGRVSAGLWPLARSWFSLRPTVGAGFGFVRGRGMIVALPREAIRPWLDVALGLRAHAALTRRFAVELSGGLLVLITRATWTFDEPEVIVHETPPLGGYLTAGVRITLAD